MLLFRSTSLFLNTMQSDPHFRWIRPSLICLQDQMASFILITKQWRHMKMVKRAGRIYDPGGISATAPGSLVIPCRACPLPNINLPRGWENVPPKRAYIIPLNMDLSKFDV